MSTINVTYKFIDGAHFFVTTDKEAAGLCVANADLRIAFDEVPKQLNALFLVNHGKKANFQPSVSFEVFEQAVIGTKLVTKGADPGGMIMAALVHPWMYEAHKQ